MNATSVRTPLLRPIPRTALLTTAMCLLLAGRGVAQPEIKVVLPERAHPYLACTAEELARVRQAYRGQGEEHDVVAAFEKEAERFLDEPVSFPPRGGQHNQWYQCDKCEIALKTIDATHHQCPKCGRTYSGPPYDDVIFSREHSRNLRQMRTAPGPYAVSGDKRSRYAAMVLLDTPSGMSSIPTTAIPAHRIRRVARAATSTSRRSTRRSACRRRSARLTT